MEAEEESVAVARAAAGDELLAVLRGQRSSNRDPALLVDLRRSQWGSRNGPRAETGPSRYLHGGGRCGRQQATGPELPRPAA